MKRAVEQTFKGSTTLISSYDSTKINLGTLMNQNTGSNNTDNYVGPMTVAVARPMEQSTAVSAAFPHVISWSSTINWVFLADNATANADRKITFYEHNLTTNTLNWKGYINLHFVTNSTTKTIRGFRALYTTDSVGTVAVSGTGVTGTGTSFVTNRHSAGARIGFGSTDPTQISTWYEISSIASDTSITLTGSAPTLSAGTAYVIEELRFAVAMTNATTTNGGLFLVKGIHYSVFSTIGVNILEAGTSDNTRGVYWLADAATVTNTVACGLGIDTSPTLTQHYCWVLNGTTTAQIFKYDLRASLTGLSAGKTTSAFIFSTGTSATLTGTATQINNGRVFTVNHGPALGVKSFYFATSTRIYRCAESGITSGSTSFLSDNMVEVPPGGTTTFTASGAMQSVDYADSIDRLIIMTSGSTGLRSYVTQYNTVSSPFDHIFLVDTKQLDQSTASSNTTPLPSIDASGFSPWSQNGILYLSRNTASSTTNQIYALPFGVHWTYASSTSQRIITPSISTPSCTKFVRFYVNESSQLGTGDLGVPTEPYRVYARTSGISDNSGSWTLLDDTGDLSSFGAATSIQFMFEFKALGLTCIPTRIYNCGVVYEDDSTTSYYSPSVGKSDVTNRIFAWRQASSWGGTIPNLNIKVYNLSTSATVIDDTVTASATGTWQYSTDGITWNTWSSSADAVGNYIRYTATSLPNAALRAVLLQA